MRILVFGGSGQVGTELRRRAGPALRVDAPDRAAANLAHPGALAAHVADADADAVINVAAYTAVDRAETEPEAAATINAVAPGVMATAAAARGLPFLHVSTDYVFDGARSTPWPEDAPTAPLGVYGRTKLDGERAVAAAGGRAAVLRTAWVFSAHGANFVKTMLRAGGARSRLTVVDDQHGGPTPAAAIAETLLSMASALAAGRGGTGVFHYCGAPTVTWRGFAEEIFRRAAPPDPPEIAPIAAADWPTPARRPAYSALDCARIARVFGVAQPDWRAGLDAVLADLAAAAGSRP